ncbi:nucleotidyltransferase family protein [Spirosoma sp. KUDC1026]|uniref:nucleotidyltransferase family protein n=1 Tax=Spirosoma sp. KUDC1026 TaxID=2745947 RepID=UPI00159B8F40|nr:nucleotidyltransferase domain-containing protein [Spirosoma sp. KUDC1026]QKZ11995.1 nucleotidyltransferase domain-containing protein [Spirosoma sp. KUDC1026]
MIKESFLSAYKEQLTDLCQQYGVLRMYAFGSIIREDFDQQKSDVDLLVELPDELLPERKGDIYFKLLFELEKLFNRKVDLLLSQPFRNPYFARAIEQSKELVYAA